jgi:hypothetical protein
MHGEQKNPLEHPGNQLQNLPVAEQGQLAIDNQVVKNIAIK